MSETMANIHYRAPCPNCQREVTWESRLCRTKEGTSISVTEAHCACTSRTEVAA